MNSDNNDFNNNDSNNSIVNDTINTNTYYYSNYTTPTKQHIITTIPNAPIKKHNYNRILFRRNHSQLPIIKE